MVAAFVYSHEYNVVVEPQQIKNITRQEESDR